MAFLVKYGNSYRQALNGVMVGPLNIPHHRRHGMVEPCLPELTAAGTEIIDEKDSSKTSNCPNHLVNIKVIDDTKGAEDGRRAPKGTP